MDPITALISGGTSAIKGIGGAIMASKAKKEISRLLDNRTPYKRPEEYGKELAIREQGLSRRLPGEGLTSDRIGGATSQAYGAAERGAISSNTYGRSVGDIYQKQLNAYQDLGVRSAEYQDLQRDKYTQTLQRGAGYSDTEYQENVLRPWEIRMNQLAGEKVAGQQGMWSGAEGVASSAMNFMGTQYAQKIMKGLTTGAGV